MSDATLFLTDERTFWHSTGVQALFMPVGDWVEPPAGSYGADTPGSKRRLLNLVRAAGLDSALEMRSAAPATREDLLRVHPASYIDEFKRLSDAGGGELGVFAPFSKGGFEIASLSAGLAIEAVDAVLTGRARNAYALCRPAGHHCLEHEPMGFCLLANIPIAIEVAKARHGLGKVAVVDWDVHHGNGTQSIFYDQADVLTVSIHQDRCFPPGYSSHSSTSLALHGLPAFGREDTDGSVLVMHSNLGWLPVLFVKKPVEQRSPLLALTSVAPEDDCTKAFGSGKVVHQLDPVGLRGRYPVRWSWPIAARSRA